VTDGGNYTGSLVRGDLDQWSFQATAGDAVSLTLSEAGANTTFVLRLRVHGPDGSSLGDTFGDTFAQLTFKAPLTGGYTILVSRWDSADGIGQYTLGYRAWP